MDTASKTVPLDQDLANSYPVAKRRATLEGILSDEQIANIIRRVAKRNDTSVYLVNRRAKKILKEMTSSLTPRAIRMAYSFFTFIWKKLYSKLYVDIDSLNRARDIITRYPVILIPSHKSHLDYLLLSSIFHENSLVPPYIAAGVNLSFWPFGYIFRKTGAFFIRRSIGNDILYYKLLSKYMSFLIRQKAKQEFFIEGGRSRNGKVQSPKLGLLTLQIDSYLEEDVDDLFFLPISIAYDRILEEKAYHDEITGGKKAKESLFEVLKSLKVLKSRYGDSYLRFGEPISFKKWAARYEGIGLTPKIKKKMIKELAHRIVRTINSMTTVGPVALLSLAILSSPRRNTPEKEILDASGLFLDYLETSGVELSHNLKAREKTLLGTLGFLEQAGFIKETFKNRTKTYRHGRRTRITLDYYKNCILHHFIPLTFASTALVKEGSGEITTDLLIKDCDFLSNLFVNEFMVDFPNQQAIRDSLEWLSSKGIIKMDREGGSEKILVIDRTRLSIIAGAIRNHLEAYYLTAFGIERIIAGSIKVRETGLTATILKTGLGMLRKGELSSRESVLVPYVNNALKYIQKNISRSVKNLMPLEDLEEEEDINLDPNGVNFEKTENSRLVNLKNSIKRFMSF